MTYMMDCKSAKSIIQSVSLASPLRSVSRAKDLGIKQLPNMNKYPSTLNGIMCSDIAGATPS